MAGSKWGDALRSILNSVLIKNIVVQAILKAVGATAGFGGWVAALVIKKLYDIGVLYGKKEIVIGETKQENKQELDQYGKAINKPDASADDIRNAGDDFLKH